MNTYSVKNITVLLSIIEADNETFIINENEIVLHKSLTDTYRKHLYGPCYSILNGRIILEIHTYKMIQISIEF